MIEELRISLFAQDLGTAYSVSEKRVRTPVPAGGCHQCCTSPARNCSCCITRARNGIVVVD